jgi:putative oxidoreductase
MAASRPGPELAIDWTLRLILGGLFLYSGAIKLLDPAAFQIDVANFRLVPWGLSGWVALYLPWIEALCGAALILRKPFGGSIALLGGMMAVFIVVLASAWARGLDVSCGCFGSSTGAANYPLLIGRNFLILGGLGALAWLDWRVIPAKPAPGALSREATARCPND